MYRDRELLWCGFHHFIHVVFQNAFDGTVAVPFMGQGHGAGCFNPVFVEGFFQA